MAKSTNRLFSYLRRSPCPARRGTILHTDNIDDWIRSAASRRGKSPHRRFETDLHDGRWLMASETVLPNGWNLFVGVEITDLFQSEQSLRQDRDIAMKASQTDDLTGVSNRRHIMACLDDLLAGRSAYGPVHGCTCLIDLDHFKLINDDYGHPTGDRILMRFAEVVRQNIRPKDSFGRVGGEEFLLNLPVTTVDEAHWILKRLLDTVSKAPLLDSEPDLIVRFSAGLCGFVGGETSGQIYRRCDTALYNAKAEGRNRIQIARN
ncbi:GGDEF domain-containing protein [Flavimaricola marinus]|uniref:GGDEF domain-containing protein n=1 Tax=Flavimaricola marinus TaxID=1819565 RepID=UPI0014552D81|nr:GGDEF domain-containing protein [Flavimaricola marinus]